MELYVPFITNQSTVNSAQLLPITAAQSKPTYTFHPLFVLRRYIPKPPSLNTPRQPVGRMCDSMEDASS